MKQRLAIVVVGLLAVAGGLYWFVKSSENPPTPDRSHFQRDPNLKPPRMGTSSVGRPG